MFQPQYTPSSRPLYLALAVSVLIHALVLLIQLQKPEGDSRAQPRMEARLAPRPVKPPTKIATAPPAQHVKAKPVKAQNAEPKPRILTARKSNAPAVFFVRPHLLDTVRPAARARRHAVVIGIARFFMVLRPVAGTPDRRLSNPSIRGGCKEAS